ncbi:hypothetical protein C8R45DRAFT_935459 [Mycena sanguinolenta]|nr:hypothetical protein C8R45DRAFT_935459 [Mycena sanguinolenta]
MNRISTTIKSFRLGYTEEHVQRLVPLSAYNIVQEVTYQPNVTLPTVFLGNLVPSILQNPTDNFTPQQLNIGDMILLDDYIFNYTISQAFDGVDPSKPVSSFSYYNNPLSDGCDSLFIPQANTTVQALLTYNPRVDGNPMYNSVAFIAEEYTNLRGMNITPMYIAFIVHPCCGCDAVLAGGAPGNGAALLESPCASNPPRFVVVDTEPLKLSGPDTEIIFPPGPLPMQINDLLSPLVNISTVSSFHNTSTASLGTTYQNLVQALYHLVRLDLGAVVENQIYNSPEMFNRTITGDGIFASQVRDSTFNGTLMAQGQKDVEFFQTNERVPALQYFRSAPRLKPLGSAVTSVFVSTFAMLSVMWTVFSLFCGSACARIVLICKGKKLRFGRVGRGMNGRRVGCMARFDFGRLPRLALPSITEPTFVRRKPAQKQSSVQFASLGRPSSSCFHAAFSSLNCDTSSQFLLPPGLLLDVKLTIMLQVWHSTCIISLSIIADENEWLMVPTEHLDSQNLGSVQEKVYLGSSSPAQELASSVSSVELRTNIAITGLAHLA